MPTTIHVTDQGNQIISGVKTFANNINVFGTGTFNAIDLNNIDNLSLSGVDVTLTDSIINVNRNIFISGNAVLTGVNLSSYATTSNLALTGLNLSNSIDSLSGLFTGYTGTLDATYATDLQLLNTGITLNTKINNLSGYINSPSSNIVFTTGDQIISGNKTFKNNVVIEQTGIFNAIDLSDTDNILLSGIDIQIVSGSMTLTNPPTISGNPFITGNLSLYATTINLATTGSNLNSNINSLSGLFTGYTGALDATFATDTQLANTGSTLVSLINSLSGSSVLLYGDQSVGGVKTFATGVNISGDVGIGTITPAAKLHIAGAPALTNTAMEDILYLQRPFNAGVSFGSRAVFKLGRYSTDTSQSHTRLDIALRSGSDTSTNTNAPEINVITLRADGNVGIGTNTPSERLTILGNANISGSLNVTGHLSAASKSFLIDHPTQVGKKLQYGSLEGPEHGVFVRGKTNDNIINLPNYWPSLVDENTISVNLTPINVYSNIYVVDYNNSRITTNGNNGNYYFYTIYGERKDIPKLTVEF